MNKQRLEGYKEALEDLDFLLRKEKAKMLDNRLDYYNQGRVHALEELLQTMRRKIQSVEQERMKRVIEHETMTDELTEFLEKRQRQIFREKTNLYGRFKSPKDEAFWEGYVECMKDRYDFFENKERGI